MSFWPIPKILAEDLGRIARKGPVVELGAGPGDFARQLVSIGISPVLLDRGYHPPSDLARIQADLLHLPLLPASTGLLILANTFRHLTPARAMILQWQQSLVPGGGLLLMEDDPRSTRPAEANYRRTLQMLARVDVGRGSCLGPEDADGHLQPVFGKAVREGNGQNEILPEDPLMPIRWLQAHARGRIDARELHELEGSVRQEGMCYGGYWYRLYERVDG